MAGISPINRSDYLGRTGMELAASPLPRVTANKNMGQLTHIFLQHKIKNLEILLDQCSATTNKNTACMKNKKNGLQRVHFLLFQRVLFLFSSQDQAQHRKYIEMLYASLAMITDELCALPHCFVSCRRTAKYCYVLFMSMLSSGRNVPPRLLTISLAFLINSFLCTFAGSGRAKNLAAMISHTLLQFWSYFQETLSNWTTVLIASVCK